MMTSDNIACHSSTIDPTMSASNCVIQDKDILINRINCLVETLLNPTSQDNFGLLSFTRRRLQQYKLYPYYEESEILLRSRDIAITKIKSGEKIGNLSGYLRTVSFNVIRDIYKKEKNIKSLENRLKNRSDSISVKDDLIPRYATPNNIIALNQALNQLSERERKIIFLHEVDQLSWKEIGDILVDNGEEVKNDNKLVQKLRQQGSRTMKRLRNFYFELS